MGITGVTTWLIGVISIIIKAPDPSSRNVCRARFRKSVEGLVQG